MIRQARGQAALSITQLTVRFGGLTALHRVDLEARAGQILSIIGPNGAGKSTLFNALTGLCRRTAGQVRLASPTGTRKPTAQAWRRGVLALALGLLSTLILRDPNALWQRTINEPYRIALARQEQADPTTVPSTLTPSALLSALGRALSGEPFVHRAWEGWQVMGRDGQASGPWPTFAQAQRAREVLARKDAPRAARKLSATLALAMVASLAWWAWLNRQARQLARGPTGMAAAGIARTFQNVRLFDRLTARDNVQVALDAAIGRARWATHVARPIPSAQALLTRVGLGARADALAASLSYGERRRLEIARALACQPGVLLLDEPAAGLQAGEAAWLLTLLTGLKNQGLAIILIEHDVALVMQASDRVAVLDHGKLIAEGTPAQVRSHPAVLRAYLGEAPGAKDTPC